MERQMESAENKQGNKCISIFTDTGTFSLTCHENSLLYTPLSDLWH